MRKAHNRLDLSDQRFGRWTVLKLHRVGTGKGTEWKCVCDCGATKNILVGSLRSGNTKSCGCYKKDLHTLPDNGAAKNRILDTYKKTAAKFSREFSLSDQEFFVLIASSCEYCGAKPSNVQKTKTSSLFYGGIDRRDNAVGYTSGNSAPCCRPCNRGKNNMLYSDWLKYLQRIGEHQSWVRH